MGGGGWFYRIADYKYISRLYQGLLDNRFPEEQIPTIRNTILYFSTVGSALSIFNNDIDVNELPDKPFQVPEGTPVESDNTETKGRIAEELHFVQYVDPNIEVTEEIKKVFRDTLQETVIQEMNDTNAIQVITNAQGNNQLQRLLNIQIGLV